MGPASHHQRCRTPFHRPHSLRKSFAQRLYEATGDIFAVQEMLGHKSVATTQKYLGVNYASVRDALQKMSLDAELHETLLLSGSDAKLSDHDHCDGTLRFEFLGGELKNTADETLFLELALRGYDLSSLRDKTETDQTTAEIIKIG